MKTILWLDVDGVLLDYTRPFLRFAGLPQTYETLFDYDLRKLFVTGDECLNTMLRFAQSEEFAALPPIADGVMLEALKNAGYELRIITKLPAPPKAKISRIVNLTEEFGPVFSEVVFTGATDCKFDYLIQRKEHEPDAEYTIIEDNPEFLRKADGKFMEHPELASKLEVIGIRHPYNADTVPDLMRINAFNNFDNAAYSLLHRKVF